MGIPRLRQLIEPYAELAELQGRRVVIDGPGLAYHIFSLCQARAPSGSLFDQPSYSLLGQTAIAWLDDLTSSGAVLSAVYFDGFLPASKEPERKRRLVDLSNGLRTYFSYYPSGVPEASSDAKRVKTPAMSRTSKKAPTPAFLVPAVLEALWASDTYRSILHLVPGEADSFCAKDIQSGGGVVITSDTDLLVHDLGPEGSVAFFHNMEHRKPAGKSTTFVSEYSVWRICGRLSLPQEKGITSLAFELSMDSHLTLNQVIQKSKEDANGAVHKQEYSTFIDQYLTPETADYGGAELSSDCFLDPRISELVLKVLSVTPRDLPSWASGDHGSALDDLEIPMYLPVLVDSPSRTSAWEISAPLRQLAYGIIQLLAKRKIPAVAEFRRTQQPTSSGTRVEMPSPADLDKGCSDLVGRMAKIRSTVSDLGMQWVALAICQDIIVSQDQGKGSVLSLEMLQNEANGTLSVASWDFVHLFAQVQGVYYAIRMIQQFCDFVSRRGETRECVERLRQDISGFPSLAEFPSIAIFGELFPQIRHKINLKGLVDGLALGDGVTARVDSIINPKKNKNKNKRKRTNKDAGQATAARPSPQSRNMFDLLGSE